MTSASRAAGASELRQWSLHTSDGFGRAASLLGRARPARAVLGATPDQSGGQWRVLWGRSHIPRNSILV